MKQVTYILSILLAAFILGACEKNDMELDLGDAADYREVPVHFKTNLPLDGIQTRYMLYGSKYPKVTTIQMLCFDSFGLYVGHREATLTSQSATGQPDYGTFEGHVPEVTARIHFIGNLTLNFESAFIGRDENVMMHALETTTYYEGAPMVYWGYHREETPVVMKEWLNSTSPNTVYMLTDRAMVELETDNQGHVVVDDNTIESIESWVISNGNSRGYIAPFNQSDLEDPFSSYYNAATGNPENVFTDYTAAGRYTAQESKLEPATSPLFLYEDANQQSDNAAQVVKLILKVKYKNHDLGANHDGVLYQTVAIQNSKNELLRIIRNHRYEVSLGRLPFELGHERFVDAVNATSFSNNTTVNVAEEVSVLTNGEVEMDVNNGRTSIIYQDAAQSGQDILIPFSFKDIETNQAPYDPNNPTQRLDMSNFSVTVNSNEGSIAVGSVSMVDYDQSTGIGHIGFRLGSVGEALQKAVINISDQTYGMSRNINIYTITEFQFPEAPVLTRVQGVSRNVKGKVCPTYKLTLKIPSDYPSGLYPIEVLFATSTLNAYSDVSAGTASGSFGVKVESTSNLRNSTTLTDWNYNAANWGYYYSHTLYEAPGNDGEVNIYFDDVRQMRGTQASTVGLFLKIKNFGDVKEVVYSN